MRRLDESEAPVPPWAEARHRPRPLRTRLAVLARALAREDGGLTRLPRRVQPAKLAHRLDRLADLLAAENADGLYRALISRWNAPERLVLDAREHRGAFFEAEALGFIGEFVERMQAIDTLTYLPDDILTKVDRARMAVSLEARVPILDHRVVELAWALPFHFKVRDGTSKWLLRQVL